MSANDIPITIAQRRNLLNLQQTSFLQSRTEGRLSSGLKVATILDDPVVFYRARTLTDLATDYTRYQQEIDQSISAVATFTGALDTVESLLRQIRNLAESHRNTSTIERRAASGQVRALGQQIIELSQDVSFQGAQLLTNSGTDLTVRLAKRTASILQINSLELINTAVAAGNIGSGSFSVNWVGANNSYIASNIFAFSTSGSFTVIGRSNTNIALLTQGLARIDSAIDRIRGHARQFASYASILQLRIQFTRDYTNELTGGSDKLLLADLNEEGANLTALQTRQQLGIQTLRFANQQQQSILTLLQR